MKLSKVTLISAFPLIIAAATLMPCASLAQEAPAAALPADAPVVQEQESAIPVVERDLTPAQVKQLKEEIERVANATAPAKPRTKEYSLRVGTDLGVSASNTTGLTVPAGLSLSGKARVFNTRREDERRRRSHQVDLFVDAAARAAILPEGMRAESRANTGATYSTTDRYGVRAGGGVLVSLEKNHNPRGLNFGLTQAGVEGVVALFDEDLVLKSRVQIGEVQSDQDRSFGLVLGSSLLANLTKKLSLKRGQTLNVDFGADYIQANFTEKGKVLRVYAGSQFQLNPYFGFYSRFLVADQSSVSDQLNKSITDVSFTTGAQGSFDLYPLIEQVSKTGQEADAAH